MTKKFLIVGFFILLLSSTLGAFIGYSSNRSTTDYFHWITLNPPDSKVVSELIDIDVWSGGSFVFVKTQDGIGYEHYSKGTWEIISDAEVDRAKNSREIFKKALQGEWNFLRDVPNLPVNVADEEARCLNTHVGQFCVKYVLSKEGQLYYYNWLDETNFETNLFRFFSLIEGGMRGFIIGVTILVFYFLFQRRRNKKKIRKK